MRCPRCLFTGEWINGLCPQCGYKPENVFIDSLHQRTPSPTTPPPITPPSFRSSVITPLPITPSPSSSITKRPITSPLIHQKTLMRGEVLAQGRYRLTEPISLPKNQHEQGEAWLATDAQSSRQKVLVRKIEFPPDIKKNTQQVAHSIATRFQQLSSHAGFPSVIDVFQEQGSHYLVLQHPTGETLALLINEQGGALPERDVAEYGRQLCKLLSVLANQQPPLTHGGISPQTIMVNPETREVFLILLPLFPLQPLPKDNTVPGYFAPEQARGSTLPSSDLYSLAATLHHAVTGYDPQERLAFFHPPARRLNPAVTREMEAILARELRLSASQRYLQPDDMQKELSALIASYPPVKEISHRQKNNIQLYPQSPLTSKNNRGIAIIIGSCLILLFLLLATAPFFFKSPNSNSSTIATRAAQQAAFNIELKQEMQSFQKKGIGVSDGQLVFDTYPGLVDVNLKQQAATASQQGNTSGAVDFLNQAVNADPTDGEAQIYNENMHIQQDNSPYVTLAVGLPIDGSASDLESDREQLEAVYLAQYETNSRNLLPHGLKLRVLIAKSGANNANVATVAQFIANRVLKAGNLDHLIGVVGWYNSTQTIDARDIIASAHLPLVAQTASSVKLSGSSPYFFRVAPPDNVQGQALGTLLVSQLNAKKILVLSDSTDSYSVSLANAVAGRITTLGGSFITGTFTENKTTVDQYQQIVENNANSSTPADAIFLAGFNVDGVRLAHAVGNAARANPINNQLSQLKVVGGDAIDSGLLLGQGNSVDVAIASSYQQDMRRLIFTTFADFNEWNALNVPQSQQPIFFNDWKLMYQSSLLSSNAPNPAYNGLMIYDAVGVFVDAAKLTRGSITGDAVHNALTTLGKGKVPAYQGVSGRIMFDNQGNPVNKAVVILTVQQAQQGNAIVIQQVLGSFN